MISTRLLIAALLLPLMVGCVTTEKIGGKEVEVSDEPRPDEREEAFLDAIEEDPRNVRAYYGLGRHYEAGLRLTEAYSAFEHFQREVTRLEKDQKLKGAARSTLGHWHMGTLALRIGDQNRAANHFLQILDRQPEKLEQAKPNPHFRDTHFFLAQLYYRAGKDEKAYLHTMIHRELGGTKGDGILLGLNERKEKKKKAKQPVTPEKEKGKG